MGQVNMAGQAVKHIPVHDALAYKERLGEHMIVRMVVKCYPILLL
jgi:hypothetical protein